MRLHRVGLLALGILLCLPLAAQSHVVVGTVESPTGAGNVYPFNYSPGGRYQHVFTATEVGRAGQIIEVRASQNNGALPTFNNFQLQLGHSTSLPLGLNTTFASNYSGTPHVGLGPTNFTPTNMVIGANTYARFPLTSPFNYNGTDNIVIDWGYDTKTGGGWSVPTSGLAPGRQRLFSQTNASATTGSPGSGGDWVVHLVFLDGPTLTVAPTAGTALPVFANDQGPGGNGIEAGKFTIASNNQSPLSVMTGIDITASGTGDDAAAISEVMLYRDDTGGASVGAYDPADYVVGGPDVFTANDGTINFNVVTSEQGFNQSETRTYFVVVKLAGTALPGHTFSFAVSDITVTTGNKTVPAAATMTGLVVDTPQFVFTDASPAVEKVFLTFSGVCQVFTIGYPNGPADKPDSISVGALGTADESTDLVEAQLWWDADNNSTFSATADTQIDAQSFTQDNGIVVFSLASVTPFQAGQTRRFFVVYQLNANASDLETFRCYITDMGPAPLGGSATGLPAPSVNGTPGLEVSAAILFGIMNGPVAPVTVNSDAQGPANEGVLLADVTLKALPGGAWIINTVQFNAGGSGSHNNAYSELALYEDVNKSGTWDGAAIDGLAAPVLDTFAANVAEFDLILSALAQGTERRFFLRARLNGSALTGQTFGARLTDVIASPPPGGSYSGFPTQASTALIVDVPALAVSNSPYQPDPLTHAAGTAGELVAASFRLNALNGPTTVNGLTLTGSGTGDWSSDVDSATGVRVYRDNGDGVYSAADGPSLFQGGGGTTVPAPFTTSLNLAGGEMADLWVVIGLTATAGAGVAATPETFALSIAGTGDVTASAPVAFGMEAPDGVTVGAIEFAVSNFSPVTGSNAGGQPLIISGSGFIAPFSVTIGGSLCAGTPIIAGGTQVTGLAIPTGVGVDLPIVVYSGTLPPQTLAVTFSYTSPKDTPPPKADESSCSGANSGSWFAVFGLISLLGWAAYRRRTA
jgi:hypothetical protein